MLEKIRISLAENQRLFFSNRNQMINRGDVMLVVAKNSKKSIIEKTLMIKKIHLEKFPFQIWTRKIISLNNFYDKHCAKSVHIWSCSGPYFPAFGLNMEPYSASLPIQSECGKIRTNIRLGQLISDSNTDIFHTVRGERYHFIWKAYDADKLCFDLL